MEGNNNEYLLIVTNMMYFNILLVINTVELSLLVGDHWSWVTLAHELTCTSLEHYTSICF